MSWELLIPLIAQYGLPVAERIWTLWAAGSPPTKEAWESLRQLASQTAKDRMLLAIQRAGIDPESEEGKALLALG